MSADDLTGPPHPDPTDDELLLADLAAGLDESLAPEPGSILLAASARRPFGNSIHAVDHVSSVDAYDRIHGVLEELLSGLTPAEWAAVVAPYGWSVRSLVAHLVEIDRYFAGVLGIGAYEIEPEAALDHVEMTRPAVDAWTADDAATLVAWRTGNETVRAALARDFGHRLDERFPFHMLHSRLDTLLVVRVFELWTHVEDIHRSIGRALAPVDPALLWRMSRIAVPAVPLGLLLHGIDLGEHTVRFVLTGPGGGTFDQPMQVGQVAGPIDLIVIADVTDFCRVAAQRLAPSDLPVEIEGDRELALRVLTGAAAFAA
jgi:uncharacterized protein (TIGR03083 family)